MLRALVERGHTATVCLSQSPPVSDAYVLDGVTVVPSGARPRMGEAARAADVVVSHLLNVPDAGALAAALGLPFVVVCPLERERLWRDMASTRPALAVYVSRWMRHAAGVWFEAHPECSRPRHSLVVRGPVVAREYHATPGEVVTLVNMNANKGGDLLCRLAARAPGQQFLGVRGAYDPQVEPPEPLPNLEVIDQVPGRLMAERVYSRTRILLVASREDAWPRVAVEAMTSGIPVVAHPTPGVRELLGGAGFTADRDDPDAWLDVLDRLRSPTEYERAAAAARRRARELDPTEDLAVWVRAIEELACATACVALWRPRSSRSGQG